MKALLAAVFAALVLAPAGNAAYTKTDQFVTMDDGVGIATTLYLPDTPGPRPAVMLFHGIGGNRQSIDAVASRFADHGYIALTSDFRGHGQSGGFFTALGPRELLDVARLRESWLPTHAPVDGDKVGAWGISLGGGAVFNSLVGGVPWAAVVTVETWTDLYSALMPQGLVKSGVVLTFSRSIPDERRDPALDVVQAAAFAGNPAPVRQWTDPRSSISKLGSITTPVFMAQGRRDFAFGIDQATQAFARLRGPKVLYVGLHGHAPSTFPAADTGFLMSKVRGWYDCYLRSTGCEANETSVYVASEKFIGQVARRGATLPPVSPTTVSFPGVTTFAHTGKAVRTSAPLRTALETFGAPTVQTSVAASGGWSRLVAVLMARTPQGKEIVIAAGGVPTKPGAQTVTIRLGSQATFVPKGSRLTLTLASSSTAQSPANLLYLDLPMAQSARARVGTAILKLPRLRTPVTR